MIRIKNENDSLLKLTMKKRKRTLAWGDGSRHQPGGSHPGAASHHLPAGAR